MDPSGDRKKVSIKLPKGLIKNLRIAAANSDKSVTDEVQRCLELALARYGEQPQNLTQPTPHSPDSVRWTSMYITREVWRRTRIAAINADMDVADYVAIVVSECLAPSEQPVP